MTSIDKVQRFQALHKGKVPLILFNIWDAGSAMAVAKSGAQALATGSWSVAAANGYKDGQNIPRDLLIETLRRIARATDLPVTIDLESGYGEDLETVAETITSSIEAGAIGCNLEDSFPADETLRDVGEAAIRISAARQAADRVCPGFFINARTDVFFQKPANEHNPSMIDEALTRARAFAAAGADGIFVPGLVDLNLVRKIASASPLPVNIMRLSDATAIADLAAAGVARISHGPYPYSIAMEALEKAARSVGV
jgi:2-methylisocitrate lyase-like PEP mutase family enzyme